MSVFDKLFKPNKFDETMDHVFEDLAENNPVSRRAKSIIEEAADNITRSMERELYGKTKERPEGRPSVLEDYDSVSAEWDDMFNKLVDRELGKYKICPRCGEAASSELENCPHCGASLPEETVADQFLQKP